MRLIVLLLFISNIVSLISYQEIPVIFIHKTNSYYLKDSLWQAQQYNKNVILIGDQSNKGYKGITHYFYKDYFHEAHSFQKVYKHMSNHPYDYEIFCIQRWFVLNAFMKAHNIKRCFYCDSDVMLYCDITQENRTDFGHYNMALTSSVAGTWSGGHSFWDQSALNDLCSYIYKTYAEPKNLKYWTHWHTKRKDKRHNVCDMSLITHYIRSIKDSERYTICRLPNILANETAYDHHMSDDERGAYEMTDLFIPYRGNRRVKKIRWKNNQPYIYNKALKTNIRLKLLHFAGDSKGLMASYRKPKAL